MTTNSDQSPLNEQQSATPDEQQKPAEAQVAVEDDEIVDIDQRDLDAAIAALEAEKSAAKATDNAASEAETTPAKTETETETETATDQQVKATPPTSAADAEPMIPKPRFDEVLSRASRAEQDAAYWKGIADARAQALPSAQASQQATAAQPTAEQKLAAIHTAQDELASKFDNGEITMSEMKKQERDLAAQEQAIREELLLAKVKPRDIPAPSPSQNDDLFLDHLTAQLESPIVQAFDKVATPTDWKYIREQAIENLTARNVDPTRGNSGTYQLRKEMAEIIEKIGIALVEDRLKAKGIAIPGIPGQEQDQPAPQNTRSLSPTAQARATKLELAANAPPSLRKMHGPADNSGHLTDAQIELLTEDAYDRLDDRQRAALLGIQ
jgi:hypothetical protein